MLASQRKSILCVEEEKDMSDYQIEEAIRLAIKKHDASLAFPALSFIALIIAIVWGLSVLDGRLKTVEQQIQKTEEIKNAR